MPRFFVDNKNIQGDHISIMGSEAHHMGTVLRLRINDTVTLFDQDGTTYQGIIAKKNSTCIHVQIKEKTPCAPHEVTPIVLGQSIPKGKKMDLIVQKAAELGATQIIPFYSMRSIPRFNAKKEEEKTEHWQRICVEAGKQSGRLPITTVEVIQNFNQLTKRNFGGFLKLILWEEEKERQFKTVLKQNSSHSPIVFLVGPEGGFTREEVALAEQNGFIAVGLGKAILRTETVSITILSILQYEAGAFGSIDI
jgi:16S rRNA (uracil1498-N3)-methyltransferase